MPTGAYARQPLAERFWLKVERRGPDECWPWLGSRDKKGYGEVSADGRRRPAHVVAYELTTGESIPRGIDGCHRCDNPPCCNPAHVFPGTRAQNMADCRAKGRASAPPIHKGERHHFSKLTDAQVRAIRHEYRRGIPGHGAPALGIKYGVSAAAIGYIVRGAHRKEASS